MTDQYIFPVFQMCLVGFALYCKCRELIFKKSLTVVTKVSRGETAMGHFWAAFGFGALIVTLVNQSAFGPGVWYANYTVLINLLDISLIAYICFWNKWSRNEIMGIALAMKHEDFS